MRCADSLHWRASLTSAAGAGGAALAAVGLVAHLDALAVVASPLGLGHATVCAFFFCHVLFSLRLALLSRCLGSCASLLAGTHLVLVLIVTLRSLLVSAGALYLHALARRLQIAQRI